MKESPANFTLRSLAFVAAFAVVLAQPESLSAQQRKPIPSPPVKPPTSEANPAPQPPARTYEQAAMEMQVLLARRSSESDLERERRAIANQLTRDLEQLERINLEAIIPLFAVKSIDYKKLASAASEIRERAKRIKFNVPIALTHGKKSDDHQPGTQKLAELLPALSSSIVSFLNNPVFRLSSPNDGELRAKAGADLDSVIRLSGTIGKLARQFQQAP